MEKTIALRRKGRAGAGSAALFLGLTTLLGACAGIPQANVINTPDESLTPFQRHPIIVGESMPKIELKTPANAFAITQADKDRVQRFGTGYLQAGTGTINIMTPTGTTNAASAIGAAAEISNALNDIGVDYRTIRVVPYRVEQAASEPPVIVSFARLEARVEPCGDFSLNLSANYNNEPSPNFGCAYQTNIAAMVANPKDLVQPRTEQSGDAGRRLTVLEKYRAGETTNSALRTEEETVKASDVFE